MATCEHGYGDEGCMTCLFDRISSLQSRAESAEKRAEKAERERDEAKKEAQRWKAEPCRACLLPCGECDSLQQQLSEAQAAVGVMVEALPNLAAQMVDTVILDAEKLGQPGSVAEGVAHVLKQIADEYRASERNGHVVARLKANLPALITADLKRREALERVAAVLVNCREIHGHDCEALRAALSATESAKGEKQDAGKDKLAAVEKKGGV